MRRRLQRAGGGALADRCEDQNSQRDPVPRERRQVVRGDESQEPSDRDPRDDERDPGRHGEPEEIVRNERAALLPEIIDRRRAQRRNRQEERELGRGLPLDAAHEASEDRGGRPREPRPERDALSEADKGGTPRTHG